MPDLLSEIEYAADKAESFFADKTPLDKVLFNANVSKWLDVGTLYEIGHEVDYDSVAIGMERAVAVLSGFDGGLSPTQEKALALDMLSFATARRQAKQDPYAKYEQITPAADDVIVSDATGDSSEPKGC